MSTIIVNRDELTSGHQESGRRQRRRERRRLKRQDALSARLAELHAIRDVLSGAVDVVEHGWVQGAWFKVATTDGQRTIATYDLRKVQDQEVVAACLVGAVVEAGGGAAAARSQLVQRTLDVTWHALHDDPDRSVHWCPAPHLRMMRLLELTSWNDAPHRKRSEVVGLLHSASVLAEQQQELCRAEQAELTPAR